MPNTAQKGGCGRMKYQKARLHNRATVMPHPQTPTSQTYRVRPISRVFSQRLSRSEWFGMAPSGSAKQFA
jgi:hypothetical protein